MRKSHWIALGAVVGVSVGTAVLWGAGEGDPPHLTQIEEVIMYGVDADTNELLRYDFNTDAYFALGTVRDYDDNPMPDIRGLALIPHGPHKGLYGAANHNANQARLVKISGLDARAQEYGATVGFGTVEGLVAARNPDSMEWTLLGVAKHPHSALIEIDPATGAGTLIMQTVNRYHGLALDPDGTIYGVTDAPAELWKIDPEDEDESSLGEVDGYTRHGALE
jgi:hypothetical protein